jgi:hypothetical protein
MVTLLFATPISNAVGLHKSIRRLVGDCAPRHDESRAYWSFKMSAASRAILTFRFSSRPIGRSRHLSTAVAKPGIYFNRCFSKKGHQQPVPCASRYSVCLAASAHTVRASLFANAQATTLGCRRMSIDRTHSANCPVLRCSQIIYARAHCTSNRLIALSPR